MTTATAPLVHATLGFAADDGGAGVAYVAVRSGERARPVLLRVPFSVRRFPALLGREIGYAAVAAVASRLRERGVRRVCFALPDSDLVHDVVERRALPAPLALPYVRLGCELNAFTEHRLVAAPDGELGSRARAEAALHTAA